MLKGFLINIKENKSLICALIFLSYSAGLIAFYCGKTAIIAAIVTIFTCLIYLYLIFAKKYEKFISPLFILFLYILFVIGFINAKYKYVAFDDFYGTETVKNMQATGTVINIPNCSEKKGSCKFPLEVNLVVIQNKTIKIDKGTILATVKSADNNYIPKYGDKIKLTGTMTTPTEATNPSQFDYRKFLNNKGILKTFYAKECEFIHSPNIAELKNKKTLKSKLNYLGICFTRYMNNLRDKVIQTHGKYLKSPNLEILGGIVFGDDAINTPNEVRESFINSGLLHLLAASGLNVALILSMWLCIVYFINIHYRLKILSGLCVVILYMTMTGFPPSIVRASVMLILILLGKFIYREANGISLIFMAGFLIMLFKPEYIADVGFQLSFLVTLGLIICTPCTTTIIESKERNYIRKLKNFNKLTKSFLMIFSPVSITCIFLVPFIAQLWAAPLQAHYFNTFSIYSILANIAVVPFIGIVSFLGFISSAFCLIPFMSDCIIPALDVVLNQLIQIILNISNYFAALNYSIIKVPSPNPFLIFSFYVFIILLFFCIKHLFKRKFLNIALIVSVFIISAQFINFDTNKGEIIFFDTGNSDNTLIKTTDNKYIMIDTGRYIFPDSSTAKRITLEYFYDKNIKEIELLIVTHYDSDHSGGLVDILKEVKVKNLIIPKLECISKNSCKIKNYIEENKINYTLPYTKQRFSYDKNIEVVNYVPKSNNKISKNDSSTVTFIKYGDLKFLFLADIPIKSFYTIEKFMPNDIDILKVSHHGAKRTANDIMLRKLRPKYSVILTGRNPYNHPDIETVDVLKKYSKVLNTKENGAIKFEIKEDKIIPYTFNKTEFKKYK